MMTFVLWCTYVQYVCIVYVRAGVCHILPQTLSFPCLCIIQKSMSRPFSVALQVHVNPSQSVLVLEGDDIESFNRAVQQVTYRNSLRFATPGVRPLKLTTSLRCKHTHARTQALVHAHTHTNIFSFILKTKANPVYQRLRSRSQPQR